MAELQHHADQTSLPSTTSNISHHLTSLLLVTRGGSQPMPQIEQTVDSIYIKSAVGYFNNLRVPAAVLMSIIMKEMFALQTVPNEGMRSWDHEHGIDKTTQVLTSLATAQVNKPPDLPLGVEADKVGGIFNRRKEVPQSMVDFLITNYEFEYATVRFHFVTGLMSFTIAQALRVRYALRKYSDLSISGMCCLLTVASGMLTYTNANTITYGGYSNLLRRQFQLSYNFIKTRIRSGPMSFVTAILAFLSLVYAVIGYFSPEFAYFEIDLEEEKKTNKRTR
eukprot:scaffold3855_cov199-Alexandrium_tamarense.AAC.19